MIRWSCALVVVGVLTGFAILLITGTYSNDGPLVLPLSYNHGVHAGDLLVTAGWAVAVLAVAVLAVPFGGSQARGPSRRPGHGDLERTGVRQGTRW